MNNNSAKQIRRAVGAAALVAMCLGAAACGTETANDDVAPAAPGPAAAAQQHPAKPHTPTSADAAERAAHDRHFAKAPNGREIYLP